MNIAYFLLPKSRIAYLYDDFTFRQGLEKMRNRGYTAIPVITRDGRYVGTVSEGDFLWRLLDTDDPSMKKAEELRVRDIIGSKYPAVRITVTMDALLESAMNQNFIPVIDDLDNFIGIVTRRDIISYLAKENENRAGVSSCRKSRLSTDIPGIHGIPGMFLFSAPSVHRGRLFPPDRRRRERINRRIKAKISSTIPSTTHVIPFQPAKSCPGAKLSDPCLQPLAGAA